MLEAAVLSGNGPISETDPEQDVAQRGKAGLDRGTAPQSTGEGVFSQCLIKFVTWQHTKLIENATVAHGASSTATRSGAIPRRLAELRNRSRPRRNRCARSWANW